MLSISEVEQDPAFERLVLSLDRLSTETYNGLRGLGSFKKRSESQKRLNKLLEGGISEAEFPEIAKELNISQDTYYQLVGSVLNNKAALLRKYGSSALSSVSSNNISYHIQQADIKLAASYQNKEIGVSNRQPVCNQCPFNNCGECNGGDPNLPTVGGGGGDGGDGNLCNTCRNACAQKRSSSRAIAQASLVTAVLGCGATGLGVAEQIYTSTFLLNLLGPEAPATAAVLGGMVAAGGCLTSVLIIYSNSLTLIEAEYQLNVAGCPCTY